ncbi:unnamed protein product [Orchesella dallaii]|uniref:F-box domain-containing protein n=1 Tax=Orchesella dallaii TaxID=48710 RepID=A0ABP1RUX8_9HEXA
MEDPSSPFRKRVKLDEAKEDETEEVPLLLIPETRKIINLVSYQSPKTSPILVPEILDKILLHVSLTDYLAAINSCPEWNQLLNSRKTAELFSMALPFIMKFLPKKDFLTLRLVCQDWKRKCEIIYDNHPARLERATSDLQFPKLSPDGKLLLSDDDGVKFQSVESFQRFTSEMGNDCGNPFPGRCVSLLTKESENPASDDNDSEEEVEEEVRNPQIVLDHWNAINQLLLQFGEHIWYLRLDYWFCDNRMVETRLRNMLLQVPNVKSLQLRFVDQIYDFEDFVEFNRRAAEFYRQNPPPKLENLEPVPFPNLVELQAEICYFELRALKEASPKLESLGVDLQLEYGVVYDTEYQDEPFDDSDEDDEDHDAVDNNIGVVFKGLHIFADTLKELELFYYPLTSNVNTIKFKVVLPKLENCA